MTIPEIRAQLLVVATKLVAGDITPVNAARHIRRLEKQMYRRKAIRRASDRQTPITPLQKSRVQELAQSDLTMAQIATKVGIANPGRVSEILAGYRR